MLRRLHLQGFSAIADEIENESKRPLMYSTEAQWDYYGYIHQNNMKDNIHTQIFRFMRHQPQILSLIAKMVSDNLVNLNDIIHNTT